MVVARKPFFEYIDEFIDYRKNIYQVSAQTIKSNLVDLNLFRSFMDKSKFKRISGPAAMQFQFFLKNERSNCGGSINRKIFTLRSYTHFLKLMEVPDAHKLPFYDVLKVRQGYRNRPSALSVDQVKQLFATIDRDTIRGLRDYAVYALMYRAGLRVGEVHQLNLADIDYSSKKVHVTGKGGKHRQLHLTDELAQIVSEWIAVRPFVYQSDLHHALFVSKKGNRLAIRTMEDNFKKYFLTSKINLPFNVTCHTLRHSFASHLNDKEVDILVIQSLLGHSSTRSTEPYIHPSLQKVRAAMEKLPSVIFLTALLKKAKIDLRFQHNCKQLE